MNFRKTHRMHHARTNIPGDAPDLFMKTRHKQQSALHALEMPHWWLVWLRRRGRLGRVELTEWALDYVGFIVVYGALVCFVGLERFVVSVAPSLVWSRCCCGTRSRTRRSQAARRPPRTQPRLRKDTWTFSIPAPAPRSLYASHYAGSPEQLGAP